MFIIRSVGCIFAELYSRKPLFRGQHTLDQLQRIISVLGTPSDEDLKDIASENAREYVKRLPKHQATDYTAEFTDASPAAKDLITKLLLFNPVKKMPC